MKVINLLYRSGAGGEFFGGLLTEAPEVANKPVEQVPNKERWFLKREDYQSHDIVMTRSEDPRHEQKDVIWNEDLWNVRLEHGYGFSINQEFWSDYCWNDWKETKTIVFLSKTKESLDYTHKLARFKIVEQSDITVGMDMIHDGILKREQFWDEPWESQAELFALWMDTIPTSHDVLLVDPYELLHSNEKDTKEQLELVSEYLGCSIQDDWLNKIQDYRVKNRTLINNTII